MWVGQPVIHLWEPLSQLTSDELIVESMCWLLRLLRQIALLINCEGVDVHEGTIGEGTLCLGSQLQTLDELLTEWEV